MRLKLLSLIILVSCSSSEELSSGNFNIYDSKSFERVVIKPIIEFNKISFDKGKPVTGKLYFDNDTMFKKIASELKLEYKKSYYYYPNGNLYNPIKIGEGVDTLIFNFTTRNPCSDKEQDSLSLDMGDEALSIRIQLKNKTHKYDTAFMQFFDVPRN